MPQDFKLRFCVKTQLQKTENFYMQDVFTKKVTGGNPEYKYS